MKTKKIQQTITFLFILFLMTNISSDLFSQEKYKVNFKDCCYNYISTSYVRASGMEELTINPYYTRDLGSIHTARFDIGAQMSSRLAIEFGYTRNSLWLKKSLTIDDQFIKQGGRSDAHISFHSIRLAHNLPILKEKVLFTSGLGYALGKSTVSFGSLGPSNPKTYTSGDITYTETSTITGLHSGYSHFVNMDLGLEFLVFNKLSLFTKVSYYKGFKDLQEQEITYDIMGEEGSVNITNDGSFVGLELGLKFKFYPYFMAPVTKKVKSIMGKD